MHVPPRTHDDTTYSKIAGLELLIVHGNIDVLIACLTSLNGCYWLHACILQKKPQEHGTFVKYNTSTSNPNHALVIDTQEQDT